ncbi:hypothetical protein H257_01639 [Aphanomyces astaci]|uniref:Band 7 domain-containing protein n=1 Tax=Aphanomyces astaci TaxID=112090 RepID=W4H597_APHAT|nr:hypothetical protein H257_01639 [Aphanomyces astaci]ETV86444.1 hypothetical protein H257_01639 [Aphanomyces astaci]|eukprot:XP_009823243.1 hypothetical protein H257_01639 [Aphanomyces astaci]
MASFSTQHPRQTVVVQATIRKPLHAESHFNKKTKDGSIPLVLVPTYPHFCDTFVRIPSGVWVLYQRWNAHAGMLEPGLIPVWAAYNRVSHIVTKHAVAYSAPVERCPTSDNVMVDIDISINFQIGPSADDAVKFVYMLGAQRFNELISMLTAEGIRGLVHSVRHDQVHDLREEFASGMKRDLNHKLVAYGVVIHNVKVTNVALPTRLSATLEKTTAFKTKMEEQEKKHENDMRILLNDETKLLTAIQKANDRNVKDLVAQRNANSSLDTTKYNALVLQTAGKRDIAFATATAAATMKRNDAMMLLVAAQREYEQRVNAEQIKQQAMFDVASKTAAGLLAAADAEAKSADALTVKRQFEYAFRKNQVDQQLVGRAKMVISGDNGEALIRRLVDV